MSTSAERGLEMFSFRCTFCQKLIPWPVQPGELGLKDAEQPVPGRMYSFKGCYCGQGRFVKCEENETHEETGREETVPDELSMTSQKVAAARYAQLNLHEIRPNPRQPRRFFEQKAMAALAASIKQVGLLEDILVRPVENGYEIVLGERRWRASAMAGLPTISAKIVDLTEEECQRIAIVENVQREDLTKVEEALAYKKYLDSGASQQDVATEMGLLNDRVAEKLRVLSSHYYINYLEEQIKQMEDRIQAMTPESSIATVANDMQELLRLLGQGYELVIALDEGFVMRKKI